MRLSLASLVLLCSLAAQELQLALPESASILLGESYDFTIRLTGDQGDAILLPPPPLASADWIIGEPSRTQPTSGAPMQAEWSLKVRPHRAGTITIPSLSILVGGRILRSAITPISVLRDTDAEQFATVRQEVLPSTVYVGQRFRHRTTVTLLRSFIESNAIQMFRQRTDFPVKLEMRWPTGTVATRSLPSAGGKQTFVLDQNIVAAHDVSEGEWSDHAAVSFVVDHDLVIETDGDLTFASPVLRFAYASRFEEDLFRNRVPVDRRSGSVLGTREVVRVLPLPQPPPGLAPSGAVGSYRISTEQVPVKQGTAASLRIRATLQGEGSWLKPEAPSFGRTDGLHLVGVATDTSVSAGSYAFLYDFLVLRDLPEALPPLPFTHFDPALGHFVTAESAPLSLRGVEDLASAPSALGTPEPLSTEAAARRPLWEGRKPAARGPSGTQFLVALGIGFLLILALFPVAKRRLQLADFRRSDPLGFRAHFAFDTYLRSLRSAHDDEGLRFAEYIAAKLKRPQPAAVDPDLMPQLQAAGVPLDLARQARSAIEEWMDTRFDRNPRVPNQRTHRQLVTSIENALKEARAG
ncbi:MAG TPA: BatD family protein [Planctomycetota bacterium]|nr:BatD family protein [Planctomycetota bacterium]